MSDNLTFHSKDEVLFFFRPEVRADLERETTEMASRSDDGWSWWNAKFFIWRPKEQSLESFEHATGGSKGLIILREDGTWRESYTDIDW